MHSYSIDTNERIEIISVLGIISVYVKNSINDFLNANFPGIITPLTALFLFSILFAIYNYALWRISARIPFLNSIPNLNGLYTGILKSSYDDYSKDYKATVRVKQNWTKILITLETETSKSCSKTGSILLNTKCEPTVLYFYQNDPKMNAQTTMEIHYGTCEHIWDKANNNFDASYYSGRGRKTNGIIKLKKENVD